MSVEVITSLLGWTLVFNLGYLLLASVLLMLAPNTLISIHQRMLGLEESDWRRVYINFMSNYKIAVLVFNLSPYLALKCMGY